MYTSPRVGAVFDNKYKIEEILGVGGISTVFKALQLDCDRTVALKILHQHHLLDEDFRARFVREAQALSKLSHANIVTVYQLAISEDSIPYLVMEYVKGQSVQRLLNTREKLPVLQSLQICRDAARAMSYVHQNGLVHRDLKPDNIILSQLPAPDSVKLVDFGLVGLSSQHLVDEDQKLTNTGELIGTTAYMSPEQCKGLVVDFRSDIYSLTVCLYKMITGKAPFDSDTNVGIMYKHIHEAVPMLNASLVDRFVPSLNELVSEGMSKDPQLRFASMDEFADQIEDTLKSINSTGESNKSRSIRPAIVVVLALVFLLALCSAFSLIQAMRIGVSKNAQNQKKHKTTRAVWSNIVSLLEKADTEKDEGRVRSAIYLYKQVIDQASEVKETSPKAVRQIQQILYKSNKELAACKFRIKDPSCTETWRVCIANAKTGYGVNSEEIADAEFSAADCLWQQDAELWTEAESYCNRALSIYCARLKPFDNPIYAASDFPTLRRMQEKIRDTLLLLGRIYESEGKLHKAIDVQKQVLQAALTNDEESPDAFRARVNLCRELQKNNQSKEADRQVETLIKDIKLAKKLLPRHKLEFFGDQISFDRDSVPPNLERAGRLADELVSQLEHSQETCPKQLAIACRWAGELNLMKGRTNVALAYADRSKTEWGKAGKEQSANEWYKLGLFYDQLGNKKNTEYCQSRFDALKMK